MRDYSLALAFLSVCLALPLAQATTTTISPAQNISSTVSYWMPVAAICVLAVTTVAAMVYALSSLSASQNAKRWARIQIYEALLSLVMLMVFGAFSYVFMFNPQGAYSNLNMVPKYSPPGATPSGAPPDCSTSADIFSLSQCDLNFFTGYVYDVGTLVMYVPFVTGLIPGLSISLTPIKGLSFGMYTPSLLPPTIGQIFSIGLKAFLMCALICQLQVLLLACAPFFLAFFMTLGLVARTLGFTRSFGGMMIAIGLGLGLVYPLLISITYGFIDFQIISLGITQYLSQNALITLFQGIWAMFSLGGDPSVLPKLITQFGYLIAGFTFIPFLNFMILDAFIVDFSKAFGEKLDFMSLLGGLV